MCSLVIFHPLIQDGAAEAQTEAEIKKKKKKDVLGFPGGSVVRNPCTNSNDTGSIPDLGRPHMLQSNSAGEPQLLSSCSRAWLQLLSPCDATPEALSPSCNKRSHQKEKPMLHMRVVPPAPRRHERKSCTATKTQHSQKINK